MADDWTWKDDLKGFLRWQAFQPIWNLLFGKVALTAIGATILSVIGWVLAPLLDVSFRPTLIIAIVCFSLVTIVALCIAFVQARGLPSYRTAMIGCLFILTWAVMIQLYRDNKQLRADVDHYAMPRHLEPDKAARITKYLLGFSTAYGHCLY